MKKLYLILVALLFVTACETDLEQFPTNIAASDSLTDYEGVLNAAYFYQHAGVTPVAVIGDFSSDNAFMEEPPYDEFDLHGPGITAMSDQFFDPMYAGLYKSILSANNVIENSTNATEVGEARFLRGLAYFKLVKVFGGVTKVLTATPSTTDGSILARSSAADIYSSVIIPDFEAASAALANTSSSGRASKMAAEGMLGKVYMQMGNYSAAESHLATVVNGAAAAGIALQDNFADIFGFANDLNPEIIYATQISSSVVDEYSASEFWSWSGGLDTKSLTPLDSDLVEAFGGAETDDLRFPVTCDTETLAFSPKFPQTDGPDHDWIELRLADVILLYAEALNENGSGASTVLGLLDPIRTRAGLAPLDPAELSSQADIRQAIALERRLELAFEGHRWFDLVRTGTVDAEMGETINSNFHIFPIPASEVSSSFEVITQNPGY